MTDYAKYLIPCEQRTPSQAAAKIAKANRPRNQTVKQPPLNERVAMPHAFMGLRA